MARYFRKGDFPLLYTGKQTYLSVTVQNILLLCFGVLGCWNKDNRMYPSKSCWFQWEQSHDPQTPNPCIDRSTDWWDKEMFEWLLWVSRVHGSPLHGRHFKGKSVWHCSESRKPKPQFIYCLHEVLLCSGFVFGFQLITGFLVFTEQIDTASACSETKQRAYGRIFN